MLAKLARQAEPTRRALADLAYMTGHGAQLSVQLVRFIARRHKLDPYGLAVKWTDTRLQHMTLAEHRHAMTVIAMLQAAPRSAAKLSRVGK